MASKSFFDAQRHHKQLSLLFYRLFVLAVLAHGVGLLVLCLSLSYIITGSVNWSYWFVSLAVLLLYVVFGLMIGRYRVQGGGVGLAKQLSAVRLLIAGQHPTAEYYPTFIRAAKPNDLPSGYARFYEFASQLSLAAGVPLPKLYVMPSERTINLCVAGFDDGDRVMIITQGAIDGLDNEALYGLVGYGFAKILHNDTKLNLQIAVMMAGLSWVYECAEWLERLIFGRFHANDYYNPNGDHHRLGKSMPQKPNDWLRYHTKSEPNLSAESSVFMALLLVFVLIIVLRLLGVIGMATHDWIIYRFNREREFLADATSMQLTRSGGIIAILKTLEQQSSQITTPTHWGYCFFASPNDNELFASHPKIAERLTVLARHSYYQFGLHVVAHLDRQRLDNAKKASEHHDPITPLDDELMQFEAFTDTIVAGRLVVDQAWFDWGSQAAPFTTKPNDDPSSNNNQPKVAMSVSAMDKAGVLLSDDIYHQDGLSFAKADALPWIIEQQKRKLVGSLALIEVILLCQNGIDQPVINRSNNDRFNGQSNNNKTNNSQSKPKSANGKLDGYNDKPKDTTTDKITDKSDKPLYDLYHSFGGAAIAILPHHLDGKLIQAVARLPRSNDSPMMMASLRALNFHINNPNIAINDKQRQLLHRYQAGLIKLVSQTIIAPKPDLMFDVNLIKKQLPKLWQAVVLASVLDHLSAFGQPPIKAWQRVLFDGVLKHWHAQPIEPAPIEQTKLTKVKPTQAQTQAHPPQIIAIMVILLAFLVAVQDNSLLLAKKSALLDALNRLCLLVSLPVLSDDDGWYWLNQSQHLTVSDWAVCLLVVKDYYKNQTIEKPLPTSQTTANLAQNNSQANAKTPSHHSPISTNNADQWLFNWLATIETALVYDGKFCLFEQQFCELLQAFYDRPITDTA